MRSACRGICLPLPQRFSKHRTESRRCTDIRRPCGCPEELLEAGTKPFGEPVIQDLDAKHSRERLVGLSSTRAVPRASERTPHTKFECVRLVFVAGQNPRQTFGGVVFQQKNLIADRSCQASRKREVCTV